MGSAAGEKGQKDLGQAKAKADEIIREAQHVRRAAREIRPSSAPTS